MRLDEYRGFRHVVRNVFTYHFDEAKLEKLVLGAGDTFAQVSAEIFAFADFFDAQEQATIDMEDSDRSIAKRLF